MMQYVEKKLLEWLFVQHLLKARVYVRDAESLVSRSKILKNELGQTHWWHILHENMCRKSQWNSYRTMVGKRL